MGRPAFTFAVAFAALVGMCPPAHAEGKNACLSSYVRGQELRQRGKLVAAREALVACAQASCPDAVRGDCATWLDEVERSVPTIVAAAKDERGVDRVDARLLVDGAEIAASLDGRARALDPGPHRVAIVLADGRSASTDIVAKEGEHNRIVELRIEAPRGATTAPAATSVTPGPAAPAPGGERASERVPVAPIVLGGVALGAFAVTAVFWSSGWYGSPGKQSLDECAPRCAPDDVSRVKTKLLVGNVAAGVGIAAAAAAAVLWMTRTTAVTVGAAPGAMQVELRGRL